MGGGKISKWRNWETNDMKLEGENKYAVEERGSEVFARKPSVGFVR